MAYRKSLPHAPCPSPYSHSIILKGKDKSLSGKGGGGITNIDSLMFLSAKRTQRVVSLSIYP